ncbi:hypothetical protein [Nocardia sp. NPDC052566]|uniref:hypothetical protein n=1 Tax=Nocardia sp. NPDC052566 TaxID=3364330 RepID=UPI0037C68852
MLQVVHTGAQISQQLVSRGRQAEQPWFALPPLTSPARRTHIVDPLRRRADCGSELFQMLTRAFGSTQENAHLTGQLASAVTAPFGTVALQVLNRPKQKCLYGCG